MNFPKICRFILFFLYVGLYFPSASQSNPNLNSDSKAVYQQTREEIPVQNTLAEVDFSNNNDVYISQKNQQDFNSTTLKPRFEANWRYSNDRSILMGEFWLPLLQCEKESVLFCDIRLMGDDNENKEFNVGVGYREFLEDTILGDGVAGAMLWFDRRFTDRDFQFNQVTVGGEWLGEQYDLRMNGYFPIDKRNSYVQANPNGSGKGFVGNQILVNTDQVVVEEVLPGIDFEVGAQLNFMNGVTDSTRFFLGGYHFDGDIAEDITGVRTRIASDITSDIQVGARFQHDDVRGSQTYVESTIRFPFAHKKKYTREGIWSRLDESPERDIDVVSNEAVTVQGTNEPLLNATTGLQQKVIHVQNTSAVGGNGTIETPYNTLAAAEGVATTNDLIYVHAGDSTTTNQNTGITLDDAGQMLAGSGTDLLYNTERFKTPNGNNITGALVESTTAPMITNGAGNGVDITADNIFVSGITIDGATSNGIYALNADNVMIDNVTSDNNTSSGIHVDANASSLTQVTLTNNTLDSNGVNGLFANAINGGDIGDVNFTNNTANNNTNYGIYSLANGVGSAITNTHFTSNTLDGNNVGIYAFAQSDGDIGTANYMSNRAMNNTLHGFLAQANGVGSDITTTNFKSNISESNGGIGVYILAAGDGEITTANFISNIVDTNGGNGFFVDAATGGDIGTVNFTSNTSDNNTGIGLYTRVTSAGSTITTANFTNNTADNNNFYGYYVFAQTDGDLGTINFTGNSATNNTSYGFLAQASGSGSEITTANFTSNTLDGNNVGIYASAVSDGDIGTANFISNRSMNSTSFGFLAQANGAGSTITTTNFTSNIADRNGNIGVYVLAASDGDITTANFTSNTTSNNTSYGIRAEANGVGSTINTANILNNVANNNTISGILSYVINSGVLTTANITGNVTNNNSNYGLFVYSVASGDLGTINVASNTSDSNTTHGFYAQANGAGSTINAINLTDNTFTNNVLYGLGVNTLTDGDISKVDIEGNTVRNNGSYGAVIDDDSVAGSIVADFGGGSFNSTGDNRIYDNTNEDLFVDIDGAALKAENNWWGSASGLVGVETFLQDASTVDATPFLTSDPGL